MAGPYFFDRVMETSTTTGTGTLTLAGAVTGYQSFSVVGNANTCCYALMAVDGSGNPTGDWEVGVGTYTSSGTTLARTTVLASSNGGSAVNLSAGTKRVFVTTPAAFAAQYLNPTAAYASLAAFQAGRLLLPSDGYHLLRDTGSALAPWGQLFPLTDPTTQSFAWVSQGSNTVTTAAGVMTLKGQCSLSTGSDNWAFQKKSAPATPYTITIAFIATGILNNQFAAVWRESSSGKFIAVGASFGGTSLSVAKWTNVNTFSANYITLNVRPSVGTAIYFYRLQDDGSNRKVWGSQDGQNFSLQHTVGRTDFLTADEVGWGFNPTGGSQSASIQDYSYLSLTSWKEG